MEWQRRLRRVALLTLTFGGWVAISWLAFGSRAYQGRIDQAIRESGLLIYGSICLLTAGTMLAFVRWRRLHELGEVALLAIAAWIGELVLMTVFGGILANELDPTNAWIYALVATLGPLQPLAAVAGGWVGRLSQGPG